MLCAGVADEGAVSTGAPRPAERLRSSMRDFTPSVLPFVPRRREPERCGMLSTFTVCEQIVLDQNVRLGFTEGHFSQSTVLVFRALSGVLFLPLLSCVIGHVLQGLCTIQTPQ